MKTLQEYITELKQLCIQMENDFQTPFKDALIHKTYHYDQDHYTTQFVEIEDLNVDIQFADKSSLIKRNHE